MKAEKAERDARSLVTRRTGIPAEQREMLAGHLERQPDLEQVNPEGFAIQVSAVENREQQLACAIDDLAAAAHVLADAKAAA